MRKYARHLLLLTTTFLIGLAAFALWYIKPAEPGIELSAVPSISKSLSKPRQTLSNETLLSETENAYNPIPNSDGSLIAYVRIGRNSLPGIHRETLTSQVAVMDIEGHIQMEKSLADAFLYGWSDDDQSLNCFRDGTYSTVSLNGKILREGKLPQVGLLFHYLERVAFLPGTNSVLWLQNYFTNLEKTEIFPHEYAITKGDFVGAAIQSTEGEVVRHKSEFDIDSVMIPSPDGRYLAIASSLSFGSNNNLLIYDRQKSLWTNLGVIVIHPDVGRDELRPAWAPWFADSSKLVFATASGITISSPDGKSKRVIAKPQQASGLAVPSPSGDFVAFATFEPTISFCGNSTIWVTPVSAKSKAHPVTKKNPDETWSLRWLNNDQLVFDRVADEPVYGKIRLWKVDISQ